MTTPNYPKIRYSTMTYLLYVSFQMMHAVNRTVIQYSQYIGQFQI